MTTSSRRLSQAELDLLELIRQFEEATGRKYDPTWGPPTAEDWEDWEVQQGAPDTSAFAAGAAPAVVDPGLRGTMGPGGTVPAPPTPAPVATPDDIAASKLPPLIQKRRDDAARAAAVPRSTDDGSMAGDFFSAAATRVGEFLEPAIETVRGAAAPIAQAFISGQTAAQTAEELQYRPYTKSLQEDEVDADEYKRRLEEPGQKLNESLKAFADAYKDTEGSYAQKMQAGNTASREVFPEIPDEAYLATEILIEEVGLLALTAGGSGLLTVGKALRAGANALRKYDNEALTALGNLVKTAAIPIEVTGRAGQAPIKLENWLGEKGIKLVGLGGRRLFRGLTDAPGGAKAPDATFVDDTIEADDFLEPEPLVTDPDAQAQLDDIERRILNPVEDEYGDVAPEDADFFALEQERERLLARGNVASGMDDDMVQAAWEQARRGGRANVQAELEDTELIIQGEIDSLELDPDLLLRPNSEPRKRLEILFGERETLIAAGGRSDPEVSSQFDRFRKENGILLPEELKDLQLATAAVRPPSVPTGKAAFLDAINEELSEIGDEIDLLLDYEERLDPLLSPEEVELALLKEQVNQAATRLSANWIEALPDEYLDTLHLRYQDYIPGDSVFQRVAGEYTRMPGDPFEPAIIKISRKLGSYEGHPEQVIIHEVVHHLEQFIPADDVRKLFTQWHRELDTFGQDVIDEANELRALAQVQALSGSEIDKLNRAYRYEGGFREWVADVLTDRALRDIYMGIPSYRNIIQKILDVIQNMAAATRDLVMGRDPDTASRVYKNLIFGNYSAADRRFVADNFEVFPGVIATDRPWHSPVLQTQKSPLASYDPEFIGDPDDPDLAAVNEFFAQDIRPGSKRFLDGQEVRVEEIVPTVDDPEEFIAMVVDLDNKGRKVRNAVPREVSLERLGDAEDTTDLVPATLAKGIIGTYKGQRVRIESMQGDRLSVVAITKNNTVVEGPKKFSGVIDVDEFDAVSEIIGTPEKPVTAIPSGAPTAPAPVAPVAPRATPFEIATTPGAAMEQRVSGNYALVNAGASRGMSAPGVERTEFLVFELDTNAQIGKLEVNLTPDNKIESLINIELSPGKRGAGAGRQIVESLVASTDNGLSIYDIEPNAMGFWEKIPGFEVRPGRGLKPDGFIARQAADVPAPAPTAPAPAVVAPTVAEPAPTPTKGRKIPGGKGTATKYAAGYIEYNYQGVSGFIKRMPGDVWSISIPSIQGDAAAITPGRGGAFGTNRRDAVEKFDQIVDLFKTKEAAGKVPRPGVRKLTAVTRSRNTKKEVVIDAKYTDDGGNLVDIQIHKNTAFPDSPSHNTWDIRVTRGGQTSTANLGKFGSEQLAKTDVERLLGNIPAYVEGAKAPGLTNKTKIGPAIWMAKRVEESEWQLPTRTADEAIPETATAPSAKPPEPITPGFTYRQMERGRYKGKFRVVNPAGDTVGRAMTETKAKQAAAKANAAAVPEAPPIAVPEAPPIAVPVVEAPVAEVVEESPGLIQARDEMPKEGADSPATGRPALRKTKTPDGAELPRYQGVADVPTAVRPVKTARGWALWDIEKKTRMPGVTRDLQGILERANLENEARFQNAKAEITPEPVIEDEPTQLKNRHKGRAATPKPRTPSPSSSEDIINIDEAPDFFARVTASTLPGERFDQTAMALHEAAIAAGQREGQRIVNAGNETLLKHGIGIRKGLSVVARDEDKIVLDELYTALHNPSKVESGEIVVPENLREIYDELRDVTDWEEKARISADPGMALQDDYFARGWKPPEGAFIKNPSGRLISNPNFKKHRVDAGYTEMRELGYEPAYWNPYEQFRASFLEAARDRQQQELIEALKSIGDEDMIRPWKQGVTPDGWRVPEIGRAFEGSARAGDNGFIVQDGIANTLEAIYGKRPVLKPISPFGTSIPLAKYLDWLSFVPKKFKLFLSFFQQRDFLLRAGVGAFHGFVDGLMRGAPIDAVTALAKYPRTAKRMLEANFNPGQRRKLLDLLDNEDVIIKEHPDITLKSISAGGLSTRDVTIFPLDSVDLLKKEMQKRGLLGMRAVARGIKALDEAMRRGLFQGTYPAAIIEDIRNNIAPIMVHRYGDTLTDAQLSRKIAMAANVKYSTIPRSQTFIQHNLIYDVMTRLFFSIGESEGLLKQAVYALGGRDAGFWRQHWIAAYLAVMAPATVIHYASTREPLPKDRFIPIAKTGKWGVPLPETIPLTGIPIPGGGEHYGYNVDFASPNIPSTGRSGTQLTLDIVQQMDTAFRVLDPGSFITSRFNVLPRSIMNQATGKSFTGDDITDIGPGGVVSRSTQAAIDMFAPIGAGTAALGVAREISPTLGKYIPEQEPRLGREGQILQFTGENIKSRSTESLIIENLTELGFTTPEGEPLSSYDDISVSHMKTLEKELPRVFAEIQIRDEEAAAKGSEGAIRRISGRLINEQRMSIETALAEDFENGRLEGDTRLEQMSLFSRLYSQAQRDAMKIREGLYMEFNLKEEREITDPYKKALDNFYKTFEEATDAKGLLDFDKLEELQSELQGTLTPLQWDYIQDNSGLTEHPQLIRFFLEDRKMVSDSGYWDVPDDLRIAFREQRPDVDAALVYWRGYEPKTMQGEDALASLNAA